MDRIAQVEKLREKAGVSYEEAKAALEQSDWDLLDAIVLLEKEGKVKEAAFSTKREEPKEEQSTAGDPGTSGQRGETFDRFMKFLGRVIHKGNTNHLQVMQRGEEKTSVPITVVVVLGVLFFWVTIPLLIIGLFFGFHYRVKGPDLGKSGINNMMDKASKAAEAVKEEFKDKETETDTDPKDQD